MPGSGDELPIEWFDNVAANQCAFGIEQSLEDMKTILVTIGKGNNA
jgi:hypothetical protein